MSKHLEKYTLTELREIASKLEIPHKKTKAESIQGIKVALKEYEEYKKEKIDKYKKIKQLGNKGKEGITYCVTDISKKANSAREYAMKTFKKTKSSDTLIKEYELQKKAYKAGVAPKVYDYDIVSKFILMEKMDKHLFENLKSLTLKQQARMIYIFKKLDEAGVFHGDINPQNFMLKNGEIFLIDYGLSKEITPTLIKKLGINNPNYRLMTLGMVFKLKELKYPEKSYKVFLKHVSEEEKKKYGLYI